MLEKLKKQILDKKLNEAEIDIANDILKNGEKCKVIFSPYKMKDGKNKVMIILAEFDDKGNITKVLDKQAFTSFISQLISKM